MHSEPIVFVLDPAIAREISKVSERVSYCGFFGYNSHIQLQKINAYADIVLNDQDRLNEWELKLHDITNKFFKKLSLENNFSFADRINE